MPKIAVVGAGSHVFAKRLVADVLTWPSLQNATIALMDINEHKVKVMAALANKMVKSSGAGARIQATTDLAEALDDADYVAVAIRVGSTRDHVTIPMKYGINQAIGDTAGPGGVFYYMRNVPAIVEIARAMERVCPDALMLNYTNPMVMLSWTVARMCDIRYVGLCHSVQGTAQTLAEYIDVPFEDVSYLCAGINHMAWFLEYKVKGEDAYPLIHEAMAKPDIYEQDIVKFELLKYFGAFVSESSIHASEYLPYFRRTPELIDRHMSAKMWGVGDKDEPFEARWKRILAQRAQADHEAEALAFGDDEVPVERSHEFFSRILNACETNEPYVFNGNVPNTGLITNLSPDAIVEVPILADNTGLHPCYVGDLPPALAGLNRSNLSLQDTAVQAYIRQDRELIYQAVQLDPLTASLLTLDKIREMVDEMLEAHEPYLGF